MRKHIIATVFAVALVVPMSAMAQAPTREHVRQYEQAYDHAARVFGMKAVGCRLMKTCHSKADDAAVVASLGVLYRMFAPTPTPAAPVAYQAPAPAVQSSSYSAPTQAPAASYSSGGYSIPAYIVQCESGGNYSAVNPSSGAGGAYQIMPSTWQAYGGTGLPQNASPAEQNRIAGEIYAKEGSAPWSCR